MEGLFVFDAAGKNARMPSMKKLLFLTVFICFSSLGFCGGFLSGKPANQNRISVSVYIIGEVNNQGQRTMYVYKDEDGNVGKVFVTHAIAQAGGFKRAADKENVKVRRELKDGKAKIYLIDVKKILTDENTEDFAIQNGDIIFVDERAQ